MIGPDTFRIPWKHNSRKDCGDGDNKIFMAWAIVSGKIHEYPSDKAKWKTNFRCALGSLKNQFEMIHDHSKDSDDPHKVYRIIRSDFSANESHSTEGPPNQFPHPENICNVTDYQWQNIEDNLHNCMDMLDLNQQHTENQQWSYDVLSNQALAPIPTLSQPGPQNNTPVPVESPYVSVHPATLENVLPQIWDLEVTIYYRKTEMFKATLSNPLVQFHYRCDPLELRGQSVCFPSTHNLKDLKQIYYTNCILNSIQRGLLLEVDQSGIYGFRQDRCNVFASTRDPADIQNPEPWKLQQNFKVQLLSFEKYLKDLRDFKENKRGSPDYTIHLCFGQKLPDEEPLDKKLIVVKVVPLICRELHERAQMEGASSLRNDNISLQISHNSLFDLINSTFGLPTTD
ncbi:interferon regulatory factor 7 [Chanos chanos]|uniref:Interferon regulatory factor 7 n=1 Tax=Chanos chanos TaxID=29144 RepID=A0A6J2WQA5_CHACN|nr:interferon regulatory factor 7 [Chanos chanos]